ncbi:hypothetical protein HDU98_002664 [Podochytrium sp. JEL0797]|nr:hypothetical protein HDU98_002664 [Podochytrium sp. JEL0797]
MGIEIPTNLQDEYVEFMHPFIMSKIGGVKQTSKTQCAGISSWIHGDSENALDSVDPAQVEAGNASSKRSVPLTEQHGSIKIPHVGILEVFHVDSEDELLSRPDSLQPVQSQSEKWLPKRSAPQNSEVTEQHGSIKKMRLDEIEHVEGDAIGEPNEADLDSSLILREVLPSFDALPKEYKDAINKGIRELLEEVKIPIVPSMDVPDSAVRVPSDFVAELKGWFCDQLRICLPVKPAITPRSLTWFQLLSREFPDLVIYQSGSSPRATLHAKVELFLSTHRCPIPKKWGHLKVPEHLHREFFEFMHPVLLARVQKMRSPGSVEMRNASAKRRISQDFEKDEQPYSTEMNHENVIGMTENDLADDMGVGETSEVDLDSDAIVSEIMPSFITLPTEHKHAVRSSIRELLAEFDLPIVQTSDASDTSVWIPFDFEEKLREWLHVQLRACFPDAELKDLSSSFPTDALEVEARNNQMN